MKFRADILVLTHLFAFAVSGYTQLTNWTGAGDPSDWGDSANWSSGVPTSATIANLVSPAANTDDIFLNTDSSALGLIYGPDLSYNTVINTAGGISLTIGSSGIDNNSALSIVHNADTIASASFSLDSGVGISMAKSFNLQTNTVTVAVAAGSLSLQGSTAFSISGVSTFGKFAGSGSVAYLGGLTFNFSSALGAGTWDFFAQTPTGAPSGVQVSGSYSGTLTQSTPGVWTSAFGGLDWTYTASTGVLAAVPEPSTWLLLTAGLTIMVVFRRRRRD